MRDIIVIGSGSSVQYTHHSLFHRIEDFDGIEPKTISKFKKGFDRNRKQKRTLRWQRPY